MTAERWHRLIIMVILAAIWMAIGIFIGIGVVYGIAFFVYGIWWVFGVMTTKLPVPNLNRLRFFR